LASSHKKKEGQSRRLWIFILLLGAVIVVAAFAASIFPMAPKSGAVNFTSFLVIEVHSTTNETQVRCVYPSTDVGVPGGYWGNHTYDRDGLDNNYPVYAYLPTNVSCPTALPINVKSTVARNYTMGDFFSMWGQPIGPNNTIQIPNSGGMFWVMCEGPSVQTLQPANWGQEVLATNQTYILAYTRTAGCH
jgi:hypothetical protein